MRVLIINSDKEEVEFLSKGLSKNGYQVDQAYHLKDGEYHINVRSYNLVLLAWQLPDGAADELIPAIKDKYSKSPIIVLGDNNAKSEVSSFKSGADDYLARPFDIEVLLARMEARLKLSDSNIIEIEDLVIIPDEERVTYKGVELDVKGKPFEVLTHLARQKNQIVSKEQLLSAIWDEPELITPNVIEVAINQIRQKMDKPLDITTIETVRRRGYRFCYPKK